MVEGRNSDAASGNVDAVTAATAAAQAAAAAASAEAAAGTARLPSTGVAPTYIAHQRPCERRFAQRLAERPRGSVLLWALLAVASAFVGVVLQQYRQSLSPYANLLSFAVNEAASLELKDIGDLTVDELNLYAQSTCVEGPDAESVRRALRANLRIPAEAREDIIASAVLDRVSATSSVQNTTAELSRDGRAFSYLAFWSTVYVGENTMFASRYHSCVMAAGVSVLVGEDVAEWQTSVASRQVGVRPCECGWLSCESCPIFERATTKTPIFKRHKLSLKNQVDLHNWMRLSAVNSARSLSGHSDQWLGGGRAQGRVAPAWGTNAPSGNVFYGADRVGGSVDNAATGIDAEGEVSAVEGGA
jgi:hypothetical protein